jgi:hypothetical protein
VSEEAQPEGDGLRMGYQVGVRNWRVISQGERLARGL